MAPRVLPKIESAEYRRGGPFSFFRDLARLAVVRHFQEATADERALADRDKRANYSALEALLDPFPASDGGPYDGTIEEARARVGAVQRFQAIAAGLERRDVTSADPGASGFVTSGAPSYVAEEFAVAARSQGRLAAALRTAPLPDEGRDVGIPRVTTAPTAAVQATEGTAPSETDLDAELPAPRSPKALIAGMADVSQQAVHFTEPGLDEVIAGELGRAIGAQLDAQALLGAGSVGETLGLVNWTGINEVAYTDAAPTIAKFQSKCWELYRTLAETATGFGTSDPEQYVTVLAPRRFAYLATDVARARTAPGELVQCGAIRLTISTNQDEVVMLDRSQAILYLGPVTFSANVEPLSGTLQVRFVARQYAALVVKQPAAIARLSGTGLVAPTL